MSHRLWVKPARGLWRGGHLGVVADPTVGRGSVACQAPAFLPVPSLAWGGSGAKRPRWDRGWVETPPIPRQVLVGESGGVVQARRKWPRPRRACPGGGGRWRQAKAGAASGQAGMDVAGRGDGKLTAECAPPAAGPQICRQRSAESRVALAHVRGRLWQVQGCDSPPPAPHTPWEEDCGARGSKFKSVFAGCLGRRIPSPRLSFLTCVMRMEGICSLGSKGIA